MKRKVFFRQSGLYFSFMIALFCLTLWSFIGAVYFLILILKDNTTLNTTLYYTAILLFGLLSMLFFGYELIRNIRQVIVFDGQFVSTPEEWGVFGEKYQYKVSVKYTEIDRLYLYNSVRDSSNRPIKHRMAKLPNTYIVFCLKNSKKKRINVLYYNEKLRIKLLEEITDRAKISGNVFTSRTAKEIYNEHHSSKSAF